MSLLYILAPFASLRDQDLRSYGHLKFFEKVKKNPKSSLRLISLSISQIRNLRENSWWFKKNSSQTEVYKPFYQYVIQSTSLLTVFNKQLQYVIQSTSLLTTQRHRHWHTHF